MNERELFLSALEIEDPTARQAYLESACAGDVDLRTRVEALLASHESQTQFLNTPVVEQLRDDSARGGDATILSGSSSTHDEESDAATCNSDGPERRPVNRNDVPDEIPLAYLQPSSRPDSLGRLAHYEILKVIGSGAYGTVLKAFDERLHRVVAIKVLASEMAATSPARKRFLREARTSAAVRHENVVRIYAVEDDPIPYLVMDYIPGQTLQQRLDEHGPLDLPDVLRLGKQIADGLAAAHAQQLIHRDVKPGNILLETGRNDHIKITDFGLARTADDASMTQSGMIAGTPLYMAPEQALGHKLDQRADLFSFGSVLYQMISGRPPFRASTTVAVLKRVVEDTPRPIQEIIPEVPEWMCQLIGHLHAKDPDNRYPSAKEVSDLLAQCLADVQAGRTPRIPAPSPGVDDLVRTESENVRLRGMQRITRRPLATAAAAALLLIVGLGISEATGLTQFVSTVVRLTTPSGTLVIETDDPELRIAISGDGKDITIRGGGVEELTLPLGDYTVAAVKDGKPVKQELVTITRNGRTTVRMSLETAGAAASTAREKKSREGGSYQWPADAPPPAIAPFDAEQAKNSQQAWAKYLGVPVEKGIELPGGQSLEMMLIPPGEFLMGSTEEEQRYVAEEAKAANDLKCLQRLPAETPQHRVRITRAFYLGKYEVTQAQWQAVMDNNPSRFQDDAANPVEQVSWNDIQPFLAKLNPSAAQMDVQLTLPTEAQWEFACRAGTTSWFCSGSDITALKDYAWFGGLQESHQTHPVGHLRPNAFGLYDIHGNVWEWCADWYGEAYYTSSPINDPPGEATGVQRVTRGGGWSGTPRGGRCADRHHVAVNNRRLGIGFRVAASIELPDAVGRSQPAIAHFDAGQAKQHQQIWAEHLRMDVEITNCIGMKLRLIPPESSPPIPAGEPGPAPVAFASATPYYAGVYEVTVGQFRRFVKETGYKSEAEQDPRGGYWLRGDDLPDQDDLPRPEYIWSHPNFAPTDDHPVGMMTWHDAQAYCEWLSRADGRTYRLPTRAEWEWAASGGAKSRYYFGDDPSQMPEHAWYLENAQRRTHPVGMKTANPWGLYDVYGNIFELCNEWNRNREDRELLNVADVPSGPAESEYQLVFGGSYHDATSGGEGCISGGHTPYSHVGFRVVMIPGASAPPPAIAPYDADQAKQHQQAWAEYLGVPVEMEIVLGQDKDGDVKLTLVLIPPGEFLMGSSAEEQARFKEEAKADRIKEKDLFWFDREGPQHCVRITKPFWLSRCEFTNRQFRSFVEATGYKTEVEANGQGGFKWAGELKRDPNVAWSTFKPGQDDNPVVNVTWNDTKVCCAWLSQLEADLSFSLPTEAQWEYACRAGTTTPWYAADKTELGQYGWFGRKLDGSHPVGQLRPNAFGLYDMHGNVWEWCADGLYKYSDSVVHDPIRRGNGIVKIIRGGNVYHHPGNSKRPGDFNNLSQCRSAARLCVPTRHCMFDRGFRVAAALPEDLIRAKPAQEPTPETEGSSESAK